ncbi:FYVE zinc finger-domain-containing protein [Dichotomocladium elegans]|nr:FYVE zinc finger-domain-containing protein [Dichotomocladium elegans]
MLVRRVTNNTTLLRLRYICVVEDPTKFAKRPVHEWVPDHHVQTCQHTSCLNTFGLFMRRHHCRSCGHIFCYKHSANQLALFDVRDHAFSNSRVCDGCLYRLLL